MVVPTTRLLVLAIVRTLQPVHGYDVRRELLSWRADQWANVKPGSIYGALNTLHRDGLVAVEEVGQQGARPERTRYRITADGEKEFAGMLRESLWDIEQPKIPYFATVSMFPYMQRDDVTAALRARIVRYEVELDRLGREVAVILRGSGDPRESVPHHVADAVRLAALHVEADLTWSRETLARIEHGELDVWPGAMTPHLDTQA